MSFPSPLDQSLSDHYHAHPLYALLAILTLTAFISKLLTIFKATYSPLKKIPGPWFAPLTTLHLRYAFATGTIWKWVEKGHQAYGPVFRLGPKQIWVSDKMAMSVILRKVDLPKVNMYAEISRDPLSPGLFGEVRPGPHKTLKKFLSPAFTTGYVDGLEPFFAACVSALIQKYHGQLCEESSPNGFSRKATGTDLMNDLHNVALDIMGESSFGRGFGQTNPTKNEVMSVEERIWRRIPDSIFSGMTQRYQTVYLKRFLRKLGFDPQYDWPQDMITAISAIVDTRKQPTSSPRPDLLQHLIEDGARPDNAHRMTPRDIVDQMSEILLAGSETTSGTIACLFLELACNPDKKAKLLSTLPPLTSGRDDPIITSKTIRTDARFEYLNACIKENLRLHPIASEMGRKTGTEWCHLAGYDIPPGTVVSASYRELHRDADIWDEPMKFWPERWMADEKDRDGAPVPDMTAYFPFSAGKHSCIGINFAWAEMRMVAANLLSRFDFEELPGQSIDYRQYITMQFKTGSWEVLLRPRESVKA